MSAIGALYIPTQFSILAMLTKPARVDFTYVSDSIDEALIL